MPESHKQGITCKAGLQEPLSEEIYLCPEEQRQRKSFEIIKQGV